MSPTVRCRHCRRMEFQHLVAADNSRMCDDGSPFEPGQDQVSNADKAIDAGFLEGYMARLKGKSRSGNPYDFVGDQAYEPWNLWDEGWRMADGYVDLARTLMDVRGAFGDTAGELRNRDLEPAREALDAAIAKHRPVLRAMGIEQECQAVQA